MNVLCAVDGSRHSRWALDLLPVLVLPRESSLLLVHAVDVAGFRPFGEFGGTARDALAQALELAEEGGRRLLGRAKAIVAPGLWRSMDGRLLRGHPAEAIARAAVRHKADLIVMGSKGMTDFRPFLLGSVSRQVVRDARCPVLVVRTRVASLRRLVVGADGSKESQAAVEFLLRLPLPQAAHLTVVTAVPPLPIQTGLPARRLPKVAKQVRSWLLKGADSVAELMVRRIRKAGFRAIAAVVAGHPGQEIVRRARSDRADLVVVGSRGRRGGSRSLMGSTSDEVVKYASCSVLVFRG